MKIINKLLLPTLVAVIGLHSTTAIAGAKKADATAACEAAEAARKASAEAKNEWTTTGKLIKSGNDAIAKGEFKKAMSLCNTAKYQGEASLEQAKIEAAAWQARVPQ